jgi:erythromycin esterase-like protein
MAVAGGVMADPVVSEPVREDVQSAIAKALRRHCEPLPHPARAEEFGAFFDPCGDARVVLLGEATHGASEFYRISSTPMSGLRRRTR